MIVRQVEGCVTDSSEAFVMQITNCCATVARGMNAFYNRRWPWSNVYAHRPRDPARRNCTTMPDIPGTVVKQRPARAEDGPIILCLMAQWVPGRPGHFSNWYPPRDDSSINRLAWFRQCIRALENDREITDRIAVPHRIGCGMGGGDWAEYERVLQRSTLRFVVYKLK